MAKQTSKRKDFNLLFSVLIAVAAFLYFAFHDRGALPETKEQPAKEAQPGSVKKGGSPDTAQQEKASTPLRPALPDDMVKALNDPPPELPDDLKAQLNAPPPPLPEDLKRQLMNPVRELPADLKAQLEGPKPELPDDIKQALKTPPRIVTIDEVNTPSANSAQQ